MSCPHGANSSPSSCSQCLGAPVRKVEQQADVLVIDGVPVRAIAGPMESMRNYKRKGGRR